MVEIADLSALLTPESLTSIFQTTPSLATPLILGALAGVLSERAGVVNISIEGMMLTAALTCAAVGGQTQSLFLGIVAGVFAGMLVGLILAFLAVTLRMEQVVAGFVVNVAAVGGTSFVFRTIFDSQLPSTPTLPLFDVPGFVQLPALGSTIFREQNIVIYLAFILIVVVHLYLFYTRLGLRSRAVSENPKAADVAGINVFKTRYLAVILGGALAGLAGAYLISGDTGNFSENMTSGKGFIALAAVVFGKWRPLHASLGAILFGFCYVLESQLQVVGVDISPTLLEMFPYIVTIVVLAGFIGRAVPPAADGVPYVKE